MARDNELIQIVDAALAEAVHKSGTWLACRPGCWECCRGPFPITQLDAQRLRDGLADLQTGDSARAERVRQRVRHAVARLPAFPASMDDTEFEALLETLPEEEACPVLDPETGACDLYSARPLTCRVFGPAIRWGGDAVGVCELCFEGASADEIAACEVQLDIADREEELVRAQEQSSGTHGPTLVALALVNMPARSPAST